MQFLGVLAIQLLAYNIV